MLNDNDTSLNGFQSFKEYGLLVNYVKSNKRKYSCSLRSIYKNGNVGTLLIVMLPVAKYDLITIDSINNQFVNNLPIMLRLIISGISQLIQNPSDVKITLIVEFHKDFEFQVMSLTNSILVFLSMFLDVGNIKNKIDFESPVLNDHFNFKESNLITTYFNDIDKIHIEHWINNFNETVLKITTGKNSPI